MFNSIISFLRTSGLVLTFLMVFLLSSVAGRIYADKMEPSLMGSLVLSHRLAVIPVSSYTRKEPNVAALIQLLDPKIIFPEEGVIISPDDWATVVDLTKSEVSKSEYMRLVELPALVEKADDISNTFSSLSDELDLILLVRFGGFGDKRRVFFRLLEAGSGHIIHTFDETALDVSSAVQKALADT